MQTLGYAHPCLPAFTRTELLEETAQFQSGEMCTWRSGTGALDTTEGSIGPALKACPEPQGCPGGAPPVWVGARTVGDVGATTGAALWREGQVWCGVLQEETALPKADGDWALGVEGLAVEMEDTQGMDMTQAGECVRGLRSVGGRHLESQH